MANELHDKLISDYEITAKPSLTSILNNLNFIDSHHELAIDPYSSPLIIDAIEKLPEIPSLEYTNIFEEREKSFEVLLLSKTPSEALKLRLKENIGVNLENLKLLAEANADASQYIESDYISGCQVENIKILIDAGISFDRSEALNSAIKNNNIMVAKHLIDSGTFISYKALNLSIEQDNSAIAHSLIAAGASSKDFFDHEFVTSFKQSPIKFILDNNHTPDKAMLTISRLEAQDHLSELLPALENAFDCLNNLARNQNYDSLNELCGENGLMLISAE
jgi:hypothetical protein